MIEYWSLVSIVFKHSEVAIDLHALKFQTYIALDNQLTLIIKLRLYELCLLPC